MTTQQIQQQIRECKHDPVRFCEVFLGFTPHVGQANWLRESVRQKNLLTTGNRWGKSHIAGAKLIYCAAYKIGWTPAIRARARGNKQPYRSMNIAPTSEQAKLVWKKAHAMLQNPRIAWLVEDVKLTPYPSIKLFPWGPDDSGAFIEARTTDGDGGNLLGEDLDFINWDEAAREKKFNEIDQNVLKMRLADRHGRLDITTTGQGRNEYGRLFVEALDGKWPHIYAQTGSTNENPNLETSVDEMKIGMSARMIQQNILGLIVDGGGGFFEIEDLEAAIDEDLTKLLVVHSRDAEEHIKHAEVYVDDAPWHSKYPSHRYVHFWDIANTTDWTVGITLDCTENMRLVEFERFQKTGYSYIYERMRDRHRRYQIGDPSMGSNGKSKTYFDATGVGQTIEETLRDIEAEGFIFTKPSKDGVLTDLQSALSLRQLKYPDIRVMDDELRFYERDDKALVQDCVMALAGAVHFGKRRPVVFAGVF